MMVMVVNWRTVVVVVGRRRRRIVGCRGLGRTGRSCCGSGRCRSPVMMDGKKVGTVTVGRWGWRLLYVLHATVVMVVRGRVVGMVQFVAAKPIVGLMS
jgi:hypothetical protein